MRKCWPFGMLLVTITKSDFVSLREVTDQLKIAWSIEEFLLAFFLNFRPLILMHSYHIDKYIFESYGI